jgi:hypothetical protein
MAANSSDTLVTTYKTAKYQNPDDNNLNSRHCGNPKTHKVISKQVSRNLSKLAVYI